MRDRDRCLQSLGGPLRYIARVARRPRACLVRTTNDALARRSADGWTLRLADSARLGAQQMGCALSASASYAASSDGRSMIDDSLDAKTTAALSPRVIEMLRQEEKLLRAIAEGAAAEAAAANVRADAADVTWRRKATVLREAVSQSERGEWRVAMTSPPSTPPSRTSPLRSPARSPLQATDPIAKAPTSSAASQTTST